MRRLGNKFLSPVEAKMHRVWNPLVAQSHPKYVVWRGREILLHGVKLGKGLYRIRKFILTGSVLPTGGIDI